MATSTLGASPGVEMSWSEMWTWKADTPASVPAGARISAGKSGKVARSFPSSAEVVVKRSPASCMPSPESPANRMTTRSSSWGDFGSVVVSDTMLLFVLLCRAQSPDSYSALLDLSSVFARMNTHGPRIRCHSGAVYRRPGPPKHRLAGAGPGGPAGPTRRAAGPGPAGPVVRRW